MARPYEGRSSAAEHLGAGDALSVRRRGPDAKCRPAVRFCRGRADRSDTARQSRIARDSKRFSGAPGSALIFSPDSGVFDVADEGFSLRRGRVISSGVTDVVHASLRLPAAFLVTLDSPEPSTKTCPRRGGAAHRGRSRGHWRYRHIPAYAPPGYLRAVGGTSEGRDRSPTDRPERSVCPISTRSPDRGRASGVPVTVDPYGHRPHGSRLKCRPGEMLKAPGPPVGDGPGRIWLSQRVVGATPGPGIGG